MLKKLTFFGKKASKQGLEATFLKTPKVSKIWLKTLIFGQKVTIICGVRS
jgi:hypothetical protein